MSLVEKTSKKLLPIYKELLKRAVQVKKSDKMSDLDVEIAGARFEHDRQKALIALDRIQDVTDIEVIDKAHKLKMSQRYGRMMLHAQREAMKSEVSK